MLAKSWSFNRFVAIFGKNMALLVQKLWRGKKLSKSVFGYFKTKKEKKKSSDCHEAWGGGSKALMARLLRK